jgi:hypothetical protein
MLQLLYPIPNEFFNQLSFKRRHKMSASLRSIKNASKRVNVAARRIAAETGGLAYWGAKDSIRGAIVRPIKPKAEKP